MSDTEPPSEPDFPEINPSEYPWTAGPDDREAVAARKAIFDRREVTQRAAVKAVFEREVAFPGTVPGRSAITTLCREPGCGVSVTIPYDEGYPKSSRMDTLRSLGWRWRNGKIDGLMYWHCPAHHPNPRRRLPAHLGG